jgi:hypothetical protein
LAAEERHEQQKRAKSFHGLEMIWSAIRFHRFFKRDARMKFLANAQVDYAGRQFPVQPAS